MVLYGCKIMVNEMPVNECGDDDDDVAMVNECGDDVDFGHDHVHDHEHSLFLCKCPVLDHGAVVLLSSRHVCDVSQSPFPNRLLLLQSHRSGDHNK